MNATVQGDPRPSHPLPEKFFDHPTELIVVHQSDINNIYLARLSLQCLEGLILGEGKIDSPPLRIDSEQMTCLLGIITERLDIIEASYLHVANARAIRAQQIQGV